MLEDTISALDFNELPSRVRTDRANGIKLYTTSVLARGGNPEVALAVLVEGGLGHSDHVDVRRAGEDPNRRGVLLGGGPDLLHGAYGGGGTSLASGVDVAHEVLHLPHDGLTTATQPRHEVLDA